MPSGTLNLTAQPVPLFPPPPYPTGDNHCDDLSVVTIKYRVSAAQIQDLVPEILELEEEPLVTSVFLDYGSSSVGQYTEFVQQVEVTYQDEKFDYNLILILDNESAIFSGRELYGYSKVFGKTEIQTSTGSLVTLGNAQRPVGRPVIEFEFIPEQRIPTLPESKQ